MSTVKDVFGAAEWCGYDEFLDWYDGDPNAADPRVGHHLLTHAVLGRQDEAERRRIVSRLLADGADPNHVTRLGEDCLTMCLNEGARHWSYGGLAWLVGALASAGLDVNRRDDWGNTAISLAACYIGGDNESLAPVWRALLEAGADPTAPGPGDRSALDLASKYPSTRGLLAIAREHGYERADVPTSEPREEKGENPNLAYGGFVVSKMVLYGAPIGYSFRKRMHLKELNGWTVYSVYDDDDYVSDPDNFRIVVASTLVTCWHLSEALLEVFDAPYGTDLGWVYEQGVLTGFWDMAHDRYIEHEDILAGGAVADDGE